MTRKRRTGRNRSQMPDDPTEIERVQRLDADRKNRHMNPDLQHRMRENQNVRHQMMNPTGIADIITQGNKQPRTWDEINSITGAGGISSLYPP